MLGICFFTYSGEYTGEVVWEGEKGVDDHCWVLKESDGIRLAAQLDDPASGRRMEIFTDQPGIQVYTGNFLDGSVKGKDGSSYPRRSAICLETQKFPDSPNQPDFPPCVLRPNETYKHVLIHKFSTH